MAWGIVAQPSPPCSFRLPIMSVTKPAAVGFEGPPRLFWLISAVPVGLFWGLQALRHALLHSAGWAAGMGSSA